MQPQPNPLAIKSGDVFETKPEIGGGMITKLTGDDLPWEMFGDDLLLKVPGGWVLKDIIGDCMCFIPDPNHEWKITDAEKKGDPMTKQTERERRQELWEHYDAGMVTRGKEMDVMIVIIASALHEIAIAMSEEKG